MDAVKDAQTIHDAVSGAGTDEQKLIDVVARRPNWHLQKVREEYEKAFKKHLVGDIEKDTSGEIRKLLSQLVKSRGEIRATMLKEAFKGLGTDEGVVIDIICQSHDRSLESFKQVYRQKYETSVAQAIKKETSGNLEKILLACVSADRETEVKKGQIEADADALYKAGEARWGTDDNTFVDILGNRSRQHIQLVAQKYKEKYGKTLEQAIKAETSGNYEAALLACAEDPKTYWAKRIHSAVARLGTNDSRLRRCFLLNSKAALSVIAKEYQKLYDQSLAEAVKKDTSGWYQKVYLTLLDFPEEERNQY